MSAKTEQEEFDEMRAKTKLKLAPKEMLEKLLNERNPQETEAMSRMADLLNQRRKNTALENKTKMDLQNLKFDPAVEAMKESQNVKAIKADQDVESEEEGIKHEEKRRSRVLNLSKAQRNLNQE